MNNDRHTDILYHFLGLRELILDCVAKLQCSSRKDADKRSRRSRQFHVGGWRKGPVSCSHPCLDESVLGVSLSEFSSYYLCLPPLLSLHISIVLMLKSHFTITDSAHPLRRQKKKRQKETKNERRKNAEAMPEK